ncbi:hypothetical protein GTO89_03260 [Heliobacterium gestii]|uniref:SnoaL-like domain-containing protein n=1 Tax=Heliomicrobium gestii TaxID=2699 RepID=A0A845LEU4_HELGE|nr:hypothetical protein [Heliomicrobium gestii]MBM7865811.1 murein L,D-transpeptidase YcbB/YkuD [Heliomicrobium gestii]MZP42053.1 hypothetical protein [Heliomicrobium gestii]
MKLISSRHLAFIFSIISIITISLLLGSISIERDSDIKSVKNAVAENLEYQYAPKIPKVKQKDQKLKSDDKTNIHNAIDEQADKLISKNNELNKTRKKQFKWAVEDQVVNNFRHTDGGVKNLIFKSIDIQEDTAKVNAIYTAWMKMAIINSDGSFEPETYAEQEHEGTYNLIRENGNWVLESMTFEILNGAP